MREPLSQPDDGPPGLWRVETHSKSARRGWEALCQQLPENTERCRVWLSSTPMQRIAGRCYPLKHRRYEGAWCFEVGAGERVYYIPQEQTRMVVIYYAGKHPKDGPPYPPA
jgi:hypothetical protein